MIYKNNSDLPESVRKFLPEYAQTLYRKGYNESLKRKNYILSFLIDAAKSDCETAHLAAWHAVQGEYEMRDGRWLKK